MNSGDGRTAGGWLIWTGVGLLLLLQALLLYAGFHGGELASAIPWDDCEILNLALLRLARAASADSLLGLVLKAQDLAPHSPVADIQAMLGYLLSGGEVWGPFLLNSVPLLLGLLVVWPALRERTSWIAGAALLLIIFQPVTVYSLTVLKADWKGGFLAALAVFMFFEALETGRRARWLAASGLFGAAVLCKLTAFYVPALALMALGLFHIAAVLRPVPGVAVAPRSLGGLVAALWARWRDILADSALVVGPYALFFLYGSHSHFNTIRYIKHALSSHWTDGLTWVERAAYYGPATNPAWGPLAWLLPLLAVLSLAAAWRRRDGALAQPVWLGALVGGLFLAPLVFAKTSNIEFSGTFIGLCLGFSLVMLVRLGSLGRITSYFALALAVAAALLAPFNSYRVMTPTDRAEQAQAAAVYDTMVSDIVKRRSTPDVWVNIFFEDSLLPHPNLGLFFFEKTGRLLMTRSFIDLSEVPAKANDEGKAEFFLVVLPNPGAAKAGYWPAPNMAAGPAGETRAYVQGLPNVVLVGSYPWKNGRVELYQQLSPESAARLRATGAPPQLPAPAAADTVGSSR